MIKIGLIPRQRGPGNKAESKDSENHSSTKYMYNLDINTASLKTSHACAEILAGSSSVITISAIDTKAICCCLLLTWALLQLQVHNVQLLFIGHAIYIAVFDLYCVQVSGFPPTGCGMYW